MNQMGKRSKEEGWVAKREEYKKTLTSEVIAVMAKSDAASLERELRITDMLSQKVEIMVKNITGECSPVALKQLAETVKILEQIKRSISGHNTDAQERTLKIAEERLKLEQKKAENEEAVDREIKVVFDGGLDMGWAE